MHILHIACISAKYALAIHRHRSQENLYSCTFRQLSKQPIIWLQCKKNHANTHLIQASDNVLIKHHNKV